MEHPYFGSQLVIEDLKKADANGFANGLIELEPGAFIRDENTGFVCGMDYTKCIKRNEGKSAA